MQQREKDVGPKNDTDVRAMRQRRRREDRRLGGEVEPLGKSAEDEFGKGAATQPGVNMQDSRKTVVGEKTNSM